MLSLEDDETLSVPLPDAEVSEDEVLEAEILEADLIDDVEISLEDEAEKVLLPAATSTSTPLPTSTTDTSPLTLMEMVRRPQAIAVMLTLVLLGAGGWYYVNNQLEPFTADSLRYGDRMGYVITEGSFLASEEYVELVTNQLDDPPNYCKIRLSFQGESTASVTEGTGVELNTQSSDDRLGAVSIRGGQGLSWLAVESVNDMSFSQFDVSGHYPIASKCRISPPTRPPARPTSNSPLEGTPGTSGARHRTGVRRDLVGHGLRRDGVHLRCGRSAG